MYQRTMTGEPSNEVRETVTEINARELVAITPLIALIIALGFVPQAALDIINPAVDQVQNYVGVEDVVPALGEITSGSTPLEVNATIEGISS